MNKREAIHKIIDAVLDTEEQSGRCGFASYAGHVESISYHFATSKSNYNDTEDAGHRHIFFGGNNNIHHNVAEALNEIENIKNSPKREERVHVYLPKSKAEELGLI